MSLKENFQKSRESLRDHFRRQISEKEKLLREKSQQCQENKQQSEEIHRELEALLKRDEELTEEIKRTRETDQTIKSHSEQTLKRNPETLIPLFQQICQHYVPLEYKQFLNAKLSSDQLQERLSYSLLDCLIAAFQEQMELRKKVIVNLQLKHALDDLCSSSQSIQDFLQTQIADLQATEKLLHHSQ